MSCFAGFEKICQPDAPLAPLTWYRLGGPARWLLSPRDEAELAAVLERCRAHGVSWRLLGRGANVLVRDEGVDAAVIHLCGPTWEEIRWEDPLVTAAAGVDFPRLQKQSVERGLGGLENLAGIPGTLGGILRMNAGGRYGQISDYVRQVRVMDGDGRVTTRTAGEAGFGYRHSALTGVVILGATLALQPGSREDLVARSQAIWKEKSTSQVALGARSAGCIFRNPPNAPPAGRLLDEAGLKGTRIGGAEISPRHANFIVAREGTTARDVLELIMHAKERVRQSVGIELKLEIDIW
ncbi:MAG: UDP-N-acetylmuramate dehydrogenase [Phycisphaerae bacterium]|jgi:UDP-N-acetylmuramate dehydrogenase